jgi:hypothetical protein
MSQKTVTGPRSLSKDVIKYTSFLGKQLCHLIFFQFSEPENERNGYKKIRCSAKRCAKEKKLEVFL